MDNTERIAGLILAVAAILSPIVTLWLGWRQYKIRQIEIETQYRLDKERGLADDMLDLSQSAKNIGEEWQQLILNLRAELERMKQSFSERETHYLTEMERLKEELQHNKAQLDSVMETEMKKSAELEKKLKTVTNENIELRTEIVAVQGENLRLQTELNQTRDELNKLSIENDNLRTAIREIQRDVRGIKKQTGDLNAEMKKQGKS